MKYGHAPIVIDTMELTPSEMCFVQYMPISMAESEHLGNMVKIPENVAWVRPLLHSVMIDDKIDPAIYIYLTVKHMFVAGDSSGNRPGWHSDGFGTDDINYIWCDRCPTEFAVQPFELSSDCNESMAQMEQQFDIDSLVIYPANTLLRLDQGVIHRPPENCEPGYRTFVKISLSKHRYDLKGNAHNYLFDYSWDMVDRKVDRNHPTSEM